MNSAEARLAGDMDRLLSGSDRLQSTPASTEYLVRYARAFEEENIHPTFELLEHVLNTEFKD